LLLNRKGKKMNGTKRKNEKPKARLMIMDKTPNITASSRLNKHPLPDKLEKNICIPPVND
jgi:hypothetical protein